MTDPYLTLQVDPCAEPEVVQAAFRALARKYHPDFGGDARQMVALNDAWSVLGDGDRRAAYDASRVSGTAMRETVIATPQPSTADHRPLAERRVAEEEPWTVLDFGRYEGWSIARLADHDPVYLEWLGRTAIGRRLAAEIDRALGRQASAAAAAPVAGRSNHARSYGSR